MTSSMTSSTEPQFTAPRSMLTLYGALDVAVEQAMDVGDAEKVALIEQYLPGAVENRGWSQQLSRLLLTEEARTLDAAPSVNEALSGLLNYSRANVGTLTIPDMANVIYAIGALKNIGVIDTDDNADLAAQVLELAVPLGQADGITPLEQANLFLDDLGQNFTGWESWPSFIKSAADAGVVLDLIADVPQCRTRVVTVNGYECVVIDAEIVSHKLSFDNVIAVVDPRNWPKAYPGFFCKMDKPTDRDPHDEWYDITETAGFCKVVGGYHLTQRLRFLKSDQKPADARLDFDLSENQDGCTKKVLVDRGFVNVSCTRADGNTAGNGVRLETRKVVHVTDIPPYAQAFLLCKLGYGWSAVHCFFGPAQKPPKDYTPWKSDPLIMEPKNEPEAPSNGDSGGAVVGAQGATPKAPEDKPQVSTKTAKALADVANYLTATNLDITKRWLSGQLSFGDLAKYGQEVGGRLASEPWKWLQDITTDTASTDSTAGSGGESGGDTP